MHIKTDDYRVPEGRKVILSHWKTGAELHYGSDAEAQGLLEEQVRRTSELQDILYANNSYALLLIFQAMDAAGKDGAIKHVMSGVNPTGCMVTSFKQPSSEELNHDFLWRAVRALPERGRIGIFNRSYYEEVLIARVHPEVLDTERLPAELRDAKDLWEQRYHSIRALESHLHRNGTRIVKFFLHVSKAEQRRRFLDRIKLAEKNYKFSINDVKERRYWDEYQDAYARCIEATSTEANPWYIVPADDKKGARLVISHIINETLQSLRLKYPQLDKARREELRASQRELEG